MTPLFDKTGNPALWLKGDHLFTTDMKWAGFIVRDNAWSASTGNWLGKVVGATVQDQRGRAIVWAPSQGRPQSGAAPAQPAKPAKPARPASPARPATPAKIATPATTWSSSSLLAWLAS